MPVLEVDDVSVSYDAITALRGISFALDKGESDAATRRAAVDLDRMNIGRDHVGRAAGTPHGADDTLI